MPFQLAYAKDVVDLQPRFRSITEIGCVLGGQISIKGSGARKRRELGDALAWTAAPRAHRLSTPTLRAPPLAAIDGKGLEKQ